MRSRVRVPRFWAHPLHRPVCRRGDTDLMRAALKDDHTIIQELLDARADVNAENNDGCALPGT